MVNKSQERLIDSVIEKGLCVKCGVCSGYCPYMKYFDGRVLIIDKCNLEEGRCELVCPMLSLSDQVIDKESPIGEYRKILISRSKDESIRQKAQYGGVVSSLLAYNIDKGIISSAVLTTRGDDLSPSGILIKDKEGIMECAGSRYTASGSLECLNIAIKQTEKDLAVVGLPCQMKAMDGLRATHESWDENTVSLRIGLFCTWALDFRSFRSSVLERYGLTESLNGFDITPPPQQIFKIFTEKKTIDIPLDEIRPLVQKGCTLCDDMTSERADISVGAVEGKEGWNTVIVRTEKGEEIIDLAIRDGILEIEQLPEENLSHLMEASLNKKTRAENNQREMGIRK